jgi:WD40 repeat protein
MAAVDNRQIFVGLSTGSILVWTLESGFKRATLNRQSQIGNSGHSNTSTLASAALGATASVAGVVTNDTASSSNPTYASISSSRHKPTVRTKKVLAAHTDGVTALAICANHNFVVSASRDHTVVIWHLSQLTYIRQLKGHNAAVSAVAINEANVTF